MIGPIINSSAVVIGGTLGVLLARYIPQRLREGLPATFALAAMAIGINMITKIEILPVVVMSLILGTAIGELFYLEAGVKRGAQVLQKLLQSRLPHRGAVSTEEFSRNFTAMIVVFCASGLGVIGALTEGLSGDYQLLLVKSMMDLVTALIFSLTLGPAIVTIAVPQFFVQGILFLLAKVIMPYMDTMVMDDFSACGGIIMIAIGLRLSKIMNFSVINFLPALILVVPFSYLWRHFFTG